jgi:solute carrier family 8 (sodium/calcium exchanger)
MALGSSSPEILLSVIEICGNGFLAGDLGPGTIVGSAAYNLLLITGICIIAIEGDEVRRIKNFSGNLNDLNNFNFSSLSLNSNSN